MRLHERRPVRDGRVEALRPRQRLFHRLRQGQAHRVLRHAARCASRPRRSRPCSRTSSATSSCVTWPSASPGRRRSRSRSWRCSAWLARRAVVLRGARHPGRAAAGREARPGVALELFLLALPVFTFLLEPLSAHYSRRHEFEADAFATRHASAAALALALVKLYEDNAATLTPDPVHSAFYDSHPPAAVRIARIEALAGRAQLPSPREPHDAPTSRRFACVAAAARRCTRQPRSARRRRSGGRQGAGAERTASRCHAQKRIGDAATIYTRSDRRVHNAAQLSRRCKSATRSSATTISPRTRTTWPRISTSSTTSSSHDRRARAADHAARWRWPRCTAAPARRGSARTSWPRHWRTLPGWSQEAERIVKTFAVRRLSRDHGVRERARVDRPSRGSPPDLAVHYARCVVAFSTHDAGGVTLNDVICAAKAERLFA